MGKLMTQTTETPSSRLLQRFTQSSNRALAIDWFSGLVGGFASATICAPLDIARTRHMLQSTAKGCHAVTDYNGFIQTMSKIWRDEGVKGLYQGYSITAFSVPAFHSLYFALFYKTKENFKEHKMFKDRDIFRNVAASIYAGLICNTVTNPLWILRTRMQSQFLHRDSYQKYTGIFNGVKRICREEGFRALFKGLGASYIGLTHAVILYPLYEYLKSKLEEYKKPNTLDIFAASLIAKFTAMVLTYPHSVIRARLMDSRTPIKRNLHLAGNMTTACHERYTISTVVRSTFQNEGIKGFYSGLRIDLVRVLPSNSIMFVAFEFVKREIERHLTQYENSF